VQKEIFKELLNLLGPDEAQAAVEYQNLHQRLTRFFDWNNAQDPMALADETLDRLAKRAAESAMSENVRSDMTEGVRNVSAFALGVARHILQEEARRQLKMTEINQHWRSMELARTQDPDAEAIADALQQCLEKMRPERRRLIEAYYNYTGTEKIRMHQQLAETEGLSLNALRNRALRTRQELETCIRRRLGKNIS
jgi:DNA-directed RNA polymerase specialized sigma24 family protein